MREYVWLGMHPVALVESNEDAAGTVTHRHVTFIHSGHLGEPLVETDELGLVLRQNAFTAFGAREELAAVSSPSSFETANPYSNEATTVAVPGARSIKLHFTQVALAPCDSITVTAGYGGPTVAEIASSASGDVWTDWLPTDEPAIALRATGCGTARGFKLVEVVPEWGSATSQPRTEVTTHLTLTAPLLPGGAALPRVAWRGWFRAAREPESRVV